MRPIRPDDRARIATAVAYTSPDTYYRRFHAYKQGFTERELSYLTQIDGGDHLALIATERDRPDRLVAIARYVRNHREADEAELAITVHDPYQRHGVGRRMLELLSEAARGHGISRLRAFVQADNRAMIGLLHDVLPETRLDRRSGSTVEYVSSLN